jgi:hypothetical protein
LPTKAEPDRVRVLSILHRREEGPVLPHQRDNQSMTMPFTVDCGSLLPPYASQPAGGQDMVRSSSAEFHQRDGTTMKPRH